MNALKQVVGIDVAQKELVVTLGRKFDDLSVELYAYQVFKNNKTGFNSLTSWVEKLTDESVNTSFIMEATGVYHQKFAYYLDDKNLEINIVLPNKISNYIKTLDIKTVTDKTCSQAIARFGLDRKLTQWKKPKAIFRSLQQLTRERGQIVDERSVIKNQLHAENTEAEPNAGSLKRMKQRIKFLNGQEKEIKKEISEIINSDSNLKKDVANMCTIPGVGILTVAIVLGETNGFEHIQSSKQLSSYAGLDVKEKLSGTSVKGKPRISKQGNKNLRKAMHLPALSAVKWNETYKEDYARLVSKHGIKMKALVSIQRKLLELIYVIHKAKIEFDKEYESKKNSVKPQVV